MNKVFVLSYFGMGDCIRFSPIFKGLEEELGPLEFDFTSSVIPFKHCFTANQTQILPMRFSKHYKVVLNFVSNLKSDNDEDRKIWRGLINDGNSFVSTHEQPDEIYKEFVFKFDKIDRNSQQLINLCKNYASLLPEPTVKRFARFMGIKPSSFEYLYKVSDEETKEIQPLLSKTKKNICFSPKASAKVRSLNNENISEIFKLLKHYNVIAIGSKQQCDEMQQIGFESFCTDIRLSGALVKASDGLISVDSYFSHVAFALGTPVIVLYSYGPNFTKTPVEKGLIKVLEHLTEDCNHISIDEIESAIKEVF